MGWYVPHGAGVTHCVDLEPGWTGNSSTPSQNWVAQCFDLTAYMNTRISLEFDFGSDASVTYPGWYIASVMVGTQVVAEEQHSWGHIKGLYK